MNEERVKEKLEYFDKQIAKLKGISGISKEEFLKDDICIAATTYYLLKAIHCVIDLASDLVAKKHLRNNRYILWNFWSFSKQWIHRT